MSIGAPSRSFSCLIDAKRRGVLLRLLLIELLKVCLGEGRETST
jgi:hypothetical protein